MYVHVHTLCLYCNEYMYNRITVYMYMYDLSLTSAACFVSPYSFGGNNIGDVGMEAFSEAAPHMFNLQHLE